MNLRSFCSVGILTVSLTFSSYADIPSMISYQGRVTFPTGEPIPDGTYDMEFIIWDADAGGSSLWSSGVQPVDVYISIFNIVLGEPPQPPVELPFDAEYWLEVIVEGDVQSPRQRIGSVGYAYMASGIVPGTEVIGEVLTDTKAAIKGTNLATTGIGRGVFGQSHSDQGRGVWGWATSTTGINVGVLGETASTQGWGVWGWATTTSGDAWGVFGQTDSETGRGIFGYAKANTGENIGVYGRSRSSEGTAVYGEATATIGNTVGIHGTATSPDGIGVQGIVSASDGYTMGVFGEAASTLGHAVHGNATATSGYADGVYGLSSSIDGKGVHGEATATTGWADGVYGRTASSMGHGVFGLATATSDTTYGVWGESFSPNGSGVYGLASSSTGSTIGIFGETRSTDSSLTYGVYGTTSPNASHGFGTYGNRGEEPSGYPGGGAGVFGYSHVGVGVAGWSSTTYVNCIGVWGEAISTVLGATGVAGCTSSTEGRGVSGCATQSTGESYGGHFHTYSSQGYGAYGETYASDLGVYSPSGILGTGGTGVRGQSSVENGNGVVGIADGTSAYGVYGKSIDGYAGYFIGNAQVSGNFTVGGTKSFLIDHPLDPENRFLAHACIESELPLNLYRGTIEVDLRGEARVELPDWFEEINADYAYHLTPIGAAAPNLHIAEEIENNEFRIAGGVPGLKVSWMVTAMRDDAWIRAHPYVTEREKAEHEKGYYIAPELFGQSVERDIARAKEQLPTLRLRPSSQKTHHLRKSIFMPGE